MRFVALTLLALLLTQCGPPPLADAPAHLIDYHIRLHKSVDHEVQVDATFNAPGEFQIAQLKVAGTNVICDIADRAIGCAGVDFGFIRNTCSGMIKIAPADRVLHVVWRTSKQEEEVLDVDMPTLPQLSLRSNLFKHGPVDGLEVDFGPEFRLADWSDCALDVGDRERIEVVTHPTRISAEILNRIEKSHFAISMHCTREINRSMKRDAPEFKAVTYRPGRRVIFSFTSEKVLVSKE